MVYSLYSEFCAFSQYNKITFAVESFQGIWLRIAIYSTQILSKSIRRKRNFPRFSIFLEISQKSGLYNASHRISLDKGCAQPLSRWLVVTLYLWHATKRCVWRMCRSRCKALRESVILIPRNSVLSWKIVSCAPVRCIESRLVQVRGRSKLDCQKVT